MEVSKSMSCSRLTKRTHFCMVPVFETLDLKPVFERINNRICKAVIKLRGHRATIISAYAHTLKVSEGNPELREEFYETIESIIDKTPKRDAIILAGDFNAKTGSGWNEFRENIGKYGKGLMNSSGRRLLEMCKKNNLYITNTTFKHKKSHRTTWSAP